MIHDVRCDHECINGLPRGMKSYPKQFNRFPYCEHLRIAHMFDTMHIEKNVAETLWQILDLKRERKNCQNLQ